MNSTKNKDRAKSKILLKDDYSDKLNAADIITQTSPSTKDEYEHSVVFHQAIRKANDNSPEKMHLITDYDITSTLQNDSQRNINIIPRDELIAHFKLNDIKDILDCAYDVKLLIKAFQNYKPRSQFINLEELKKSKLTALKRYKDAIYFGERVNETRHGKGIMIFKDGHFYEGSWENDSKHGQGYEITQTGGRYEGSYWNGKPDGPGIYISYNGEVYQGEWKSGSKHGPGMWKGPKGESYIGEWKMGKQEGNGVFIWRNGDRYEGEFKSFMKHGHGKELFANGDFYVGNYNNGKPHGYGEYTWSNGSHYKGMFRNGLRHGRGTWRSEPGTEYDQYDGDWINDKRCGKGVFKWKTGNIYEGEFFEDARQGYGIMKWTDGSYYQGNWEHGIQNGMGELYLPGKEHKIGLFQNNIYMGPGDLDDIQNEYDPLENERKLRRSITAGGQRAETLDSNQKQPVPPLIGKNGNDIFTRNRNDYRKTDPFIRTDGKISPIRHRVHSHYAVKDSSFLFKDMSVVNDTKKKRKKKRSPKNFNNSVLPAISPRLYEDSNSPRLPRNCLLTKEEFIKWKIFKQKLMLSEFESKQLKDLSQPAVCVKIRKFIHPPVWYPPATTKVERGRSGISSPRILSPPRMTYMRKK